MMRNKRLDFVIDSDVDLTEISTRRLAFVRVGQTAFKVSSCLSFRSCERRSFVTRQLKHKLANMQSIVGNCSSPSGYFWLS
jgi:hypothetical protein